MEAIILSGLQGAGKSTFCRSRYWDSHIRINYDMLRTRHREKLLVDACIEAKQPFVVDATNPTIEDRARYVSPAKSAKFRIIGIEFHVPMDIACARIATRAGKQKVPEKAVYITAAKLQPLSFDEGFDQIWVALVTAENIELVEKERAL